VPRRWLQSRSGGLILATVRAEKPEARPSHPDAGAGPAVASARHCFAVAVASDHDDMGSANGLRDAEVECVYGRLGHAFAAVRSSPAGIGSATGSPSSQPVRTFAGVLKPILFPPRQRTSLAHPNDAIRSS
jgi:hypothetical protein